VLDRVDLDAERQISIFAAQMCKATWGTSLFVDVQDLSKGNFRGPRGWRLRKKLFPVLENCIETIAPDGIGTKPIIIDAARSWRTAAWDLIAMTASDITRWGGLPLVFTNILDVATLGSGGESAYQAAREIFLGLRDAALADGVVVLNGETADLGIGGMKRETTS